MINRFVLKSKMGIKHLNRFLRENAANGIRLCQLSEFSGKKIAVDILIYLYKFESDGVLIENMYLMLSIFRHYNITPIFVFDGKSPEEKQELLQKRKDDKNDAKQEYNKLKQILEINVDMDEADKQEIVTNMDLLKKRFINISKAKRQMVKQLIRSYGATYIDAPGEADELCAFLTIKGKVWGCLSEDMDMFVYGCNRVIRYFSLVNHTAVIYDMKDILSELGIGQKDLREICVLSGTDYNCGNSDSKNTPTLYATLKYFTKFRKSKTDAGFYNWLIDTTDYIEDYDLLQNINEMFDLSEGHDDIRSFESLRIADGPIILDDIHEILKQDGFIFPRK